MTTEIVWPAWLIATPLALLFFWLTLRAGRRLRLLMDTPTSKAKGVFVGQVELSGLAVTTAPLRSHLAGCECVWFRYAVEEQWERWETETYTDSKGNRKTRQVRKSGWTRVDEGGAQPAFGVEDETGSVQVRPEGAEIEAEHVFDETVGRGDALYYGKGPEGSIADSTGRRRFTEEALRLGTTLFVAGRARERADAVAPEIAADPEQNLFLISCRGEGKVQRGYRIQFWCWGVVLLLPLPVAWLVQANLPKAWPAAAFGAAMALLWLVGWCWMAFNSLVHLRNRVAQAGSLIDVQLKRRADLIPRLVAVVAGLRDHERTVQTELAALRAQSQATPAGEPGPDLAATAGSLRVVAERYPELKSDGAFLALQRELADTETRIALARDYRNAIATHLNTRLEIVPDRWVAALAGAKPQTLWQAEGFERTAVAVEL
jgi:hypothetical protein